MEFGFIAVIVIGLLIRFLRSHVGKPVRVNATIVDLYRAQHTKYGYAQPARNVSEFTAAFDCEGKTKKFFVSAFVYGTLRRGQQGVLTYRGSRFLDFHQ